MRSGANLRSGFFIRRTATNYHLSLYDCDGIERRVGARGSSETENFEVTSDAVTKMICLWKYYCYCYSYSWSR